MPKSCWLLLLLTLPIVAYSQQQDKITTNPLSKVDSIRNTFYQRADSLKQARVGKLKSLQSEFLQDSLQKGFVDITEADSLLAKKQAVIQSLEYSIDSLKSQTTSRLLQLNLPVDAVEYSKQFSNELESFKLPVGDLPVDDLSGLQFSQLDFITTDFDFPRLDVSLPPALTQVTAQVSNVGEDIKQVTSGKLEEIQALPTGMEQTVAEKAGLSALKEESQVMEDFTSSPNPEQLKQVVIEQVEQPAVDHFAGKEELLAETMAKISKLKRKYGSLNSLSEIPKRRPNEMRGKPIIERLLPQVVFQVYTRNDDVLVDWANYIGWRFTGRLTSGAGWNHRIGYSTEKNYFHNQKRVYGPRVFTEYKWVRGFKPRVEVEYMRTFIPPNGSGSNQDPPIQQWVPAVFMGLNKEYNFFGNVRGTSQVMFRIAGDKYKSPYNDIVNVRFGFEFPMKRKTKAKSKRSN